MTTDVLTEHDQQLADDFTRVRLANSGAVLEVGVVEWDGPSTPWVRWMPFRVWKRPPTDARVAAAKIRALETGRFFQTCTTCGRRKNVGHMHDRHMCQGCATRVLHVVY